MERVFVKQPLTSTVLLLWTLNFPCSGENTTNQGKLIERAIPTEQMIIEWTRKTIFDMGLAFRICLGFRQITYILATHINTLARIECGFFGAGHSHHNTGGGALEPSWKTIYLTSPLP